MCSCCTTSSATLVLWAFWIWALLMVCSGCFNMWFPRDRSRGTPFHMLLCDLYVFSFVELSAQTFCPLCDELFSYCWVSGSSLCILDTSPSLWLVSFTEQKFIIIIFFTWIYSSLAVLSHFLPHSVMSYSQLEMSQSANTYMLEICKLCKSRFFFFPIRIGCKTLGQYTPASC